MERIIILNQNNNLTQNYEIPDLSDDMLESEDRSLYPSSSLALSISEVRDKFG